MKNLPKILVFVFVFSLLCKGFVYSQTVDDYKANLFYKVIEQINFNDPEKMDYKVVYYGCSKDFISKLKAAKPNQFTSGNKFYFYDYESYPDFNNVDIFYVDKSKINELENLYKIIESYYRTDKYPILFFTDNWSDKDKVCINFIYEPQVTFEYNTEQMRKFGLDIFVGIQNLSGKNISAEKQLDETKVRLEQAQLDLEKKKDELDKKIQELKEQQAKIDDQRKMIDNQQKTIKDKQIEIEQQQKNLQNLYSQMQQTRQKLEIQEKSFAQKEQELKEKQQAILEFQNKIESMQTQFEQQTEIINKKTAEVDAVTKQIDEKKKELGNLNNIVRIQRYALIVFGLLMVVIIFLTFWILRNYRKMKEQNNILEQQKNEIAAQAEELEKANVELEKLSIVASRTSNAVAILNNTGKFDWVNAGFTKLYGYTYQLLTDELDENIQGNKLYNGISENFKESVESNKSFNFEHETLTRSNNKIWIQSAVTPITNYEGNVRQIVVVDTDITAIKKAEQQIAKQNKDIKNSILYASRIQSATLPSDKLIGTILPESFVLFLPRDIVSGDFYWATKVHDKTFFAAADCTGHGVPGAFMSMLGITLLNEVVSKLSSDEFHPNNVLNNLRAKLIVALGQSSSESSNKDGIAIALCMISDNSNKLEYAGAENEMIIIRNNELTDYFADDMPIGMASKEAKSFTNVEIESQKGDMIYLFSDGYVDQFGGADGKKKKFLIKRLRDTFMDINQKSCDEQKQILHQTHINWKGEHEQLDDIIIFGIRL